MTAEPAVVFRQAAFRCSVTGAVVCTGPCHDLSRLPGGEDADLEVWQAGFVDASGRFLTRREAAEALGHPGRLESRAYFAGDAHPTLEAGHAASFRTRGRAGRFRSRPGRAPRAQRWVSSRPRPS